ncbi:hypothetical protein BN971_03106 [Mycobacterium numidiamassiliense]|uniref:Transmembrane protein n=1 Tax=Mycobacterium numidiamassiliense TaxID=1841861 RepID=A0A2U3P8X3_9MYCO|nr:hypothetical protein [Mycobacterium numidiamassiliense]SPM40207.1 hypothetical protein BN971_03106 [Mycobacterium numidiamassiliense]
MTTSGSEIYAAFIDAALKAENDRRDSVNTRAASAVTSATGLITLALAVFAVLVGKDHAFPECARPFLVAALAFLLGAGACAVAAGFPWRGYVVKARTLDKMINARRNDSEEVARRAVSYANMVTLVAARAGTTVKVWLLLAAGIFQILAIGALGFCIWAVVTDQPDSDDPAPASYLDYIGAAASSRFISSPL